MSTERSPRGSADPKRSVAIGAVLGFGAIAVGLGLSIVIANALVLSGLALEGQFELVFGIEIFVQQVIAFGGVALAYLLYTGRGFDYVKLKLPDLKGVATIVVGPIAVFVLVAILSVIVGQVGIEPAEHQLAGLEDEVDPAFFLYMIPVSILIIGPMEELLYRGVIQTRLREAFGPAEAIALASLIFILVHVPVYALGAAGSVEALVASLGILFVGSLAFGAIYEWTKNLPVVALVHGLYNSIQFLLLYVAIVYEEELMEAAGEATVLLGVL